MAYGIAWEDDFPFQVVEADSNFIVVRSYEHGVF